MRFPFPINFVAPENVVWPELRNWNGTPIDDMTLSKRSGGIMNSWILRTYYQLRLAGYDVNLVPRPRNDGINIASIRDFGRKMRRLNTFLVMPRGDAHEPMLADFQILQNGLHKTGDSKAVIWHWPQPGILPRDPARAGELSCLSYKGRLINLDAQFRSDDFLTDLRAVGIGFNIDAFDGLHADHDWNDYRSTDAVLAVRNLTHYDAAKKPASKLVNAWFADVPALLGPEPAYQELRRSADDFIEVRTPNEVLEALSALRRNPERFRAVIANGRRRRAEFTDTALTQLWVDTLSGPICAAYERWLATPKWQRYARTALKMTREKTAKKRDKDRILSGPRLLDDMKQAEARP